MPWRSTSFFDALIQESAHTILNSFDITMSALVHSIHVISATFLDGHVLHVFTWRFRCTGLPLIEQPSPGRVYKHTFLKHNKAPYWKQQVPQWQNKCTVHDIEVGWQVAKHFMTVGLWVFVKTTPNFDLCEMVVISSLWKIYKSLKTNSKPHLDRIKLTITNLPWFPAGDCLPRRMNFD